MRISDWSSDVCSSDLFQIVEEHIQIFLAGQDEAELVLALAGTRLRTPAAGGSPGPGTGVAFHIFAVAGQDVIMIAALARPVQPRLVDAALDDRTFAPLVQILDSAFLQALPPRPLAQSLGPAPHPLATGPA